LQGRQFQRSPAATNRPCKSNVVQLFVSRGAAQKQSAPTHVATADKLGREEKPAAKDRQEAIGIFSGRNTAKQNDFASPRRKCFSGSLQWPCKSALIGIYCDRYELIKFGNSNAGLG
jgi:hypothetical protein